MGFTIFTALSLYWIINKTRVGLSIKAVSENPVGTLYMGINITWIISLTFILASSIGEIAGFLVAATQTYITPAFGLWITYKGLIAMLLGGVGSIYGATIGGIILGICESQLQWYFGVEYREFIIYLLLFILLFFIPGGIMGRAIEVNGNLAKHRV